LHVYLCVCVCLCLYMGVCVRVWHSLREHTVDALTADLTASLGRVTAALHIAGKC
jgi:hypothetical protein